MDKSTIIKTLSALAMACVSYALFAHDADTIAFYPLKDGGSGASAVGTTILNDVDNAQFAGTPSVTDNGGGSGKVQFSSDAPAKYIFAGLGGAPVATNAQSLFFDGVLDRTNNGKEGGAVSFADIGTALSKCDEYTVEFFWKVDTNEVAGVYDYYVSNIYKPAVYWKDGTIDKNEQPTGGPAVFVPINKTSGAVSRNIGDVNDGNEAILYDTYASYNGHSMLDGKWHHIAITYSRAKQLRRVIADYTTQICNQSRNGADRGVAIVNQEISDSQPLVFGNFIMRGHLACLRVTKRVLGVSELLYASNNENFYTDVSDVVFHWGLDGAVGTDVSAIANRNAPTQNFHEANPGLFYFGDSWIVPTTMLYTGAGLAISSTWSERYPKYSDTLPDARKTNVTDGNDRTKVLAQNLGSAILDPASCADNLKQHGLSLPKGNFRHIQQGESFTCECFFKFDIQKAVDLGSPKSYPWFTVMGAPDAAYGLDWRFGFDFTPRSTGEEGTLSQWEYMRPSFNYYVKHGDGTIENKSASVSYRTFGQKPFDSNWHHLALVYDAPAETVTVYLDYEEFLTKEIDGQLLVRTPDNQSYVFGYSCSGRSGPFSFDEIRLTRKALAPSEFLYLNKPVTGLMLLFR